MLTLQRATKQLQAEAAKLGEPFVIDVEAGEAECTVMANLLSPDSGDVLCCRIFATPTPASQNAREGFAKYIAMALNVRYVPPAQVADAEALEEML